MGTRSKTAVVKLRIDAAFLMGDVARHRQGLEINFRPHDRRAEAEQHAAFEPLHRLGEDQEVAVAGLAQRRAVAVGMLVDDVVADADVDRHRHAEPVRRGEDAEVFVRIIARVDAPADVSPSPRPFGRRLEIQSFSSPVSCHRPNSPVWI